MLVSIVMCYYLISYLSIDLFATYMIVVFSRLLYVILWASFYIIFIYFIYKAHYSQLNVLSNTILSTELIYLFNGLWALNTHYSFYRHTL